MAFELRLTFFGLTGLVPNKKAGTPGDPKEWLVVLPALPKGEVLDFEDHQLSGPDTDPKISIAPHQAALVVNAQAVKGTPTKKARLQFRDPNKATDAESDLLFLLNREAVEIEVSTSPDPFEARSDALVGDPIVPAQNDPTQLHNLKWLPQIDRGFPDLQGGVPFNRKLFDPDTLIPTSSRLAAVVRLNQGTLETSEVYRNAEDNLPVSYEFRRLSGEKVFEQALASSFRLRVKVQDETAKLVLTNPNIPDPQHLVVGPYSGSEEKDVVEIKVYNRELEEILGFGDNFLREEEVPDHDFLIFYELSSVWSTLKAADLVAPQGGKGGGGRSKPCEPPAYAGWAES